MGELKGKTALITGCNRGIGKAIMQELVAGGANIIACTRKQTAEQDAFIGNANQNMEYRYILSILTCLMRMPYGLL